ncbi:hypothetical protein P154DRAFT_248145 [Amniculicola lignicola CBS 123094]|uniref:Uncharacterized protein n=1 Tax=Amniculicola lignicola CBS 123094 TaxID=1392246 RepID=A0A6A5WBL2_9PLEO|nr:hypothetical protein P154DRAFT_248145 [Amniculicola lignicola CBS 123094]
MRQLKVIPKLLLLVLGQTSVFSFLLVLQSHFETLLCANKKHSRTCTFLIHALGEKRRDLSCVYTDQKWIADRRLGIIANHNVKSPINDITRGPRLSAEESSILSQGVTHSPEMSLIRIPATTNNMQIRGTRAQLAPSSIIPPHASPQPHNSQAIT